MKRLAILGSTGSIGANTLAVVDRHPDRFKVVALSADRQVDRLFDQCRRYRPRYAAMADAACAGQLRLKIRESGINCEVLSGAAALEQIAAAPEIDAVMAAIVGAAGLRPRPAAPPPGEHVFVAQNEGVGMGRGLLIAEGAAPRPAP